MTRRRALLLAGALAAVLLGVVCTRVMVDGRRALAAGDAALARGDTREAIDRWRRAARWYLPGAPHVGAAYGRLEALAVMAEGRDDRALALEAWQAVRSSSLATRSFYVPFADRLERANRRIAEHMAALEGEAADPGATVAERQAWHLERLERVEHPSLGWTIVALLGLAGWVGGAFLFAWRGLGPEDRLVPRPAAWAGVLVGGGLVVWMLGLYLA